MNLSLTVTSDFNSSPLLFELDFNNYCKDRIHFNIILKTNYIINMGKYGKWIRSWISLS